MRAITRCVNSRGRYLNQPSRSDEHYFAIDQIREERSECRKNTTALNERFELVNDSYNSIWGNADHRDAGDVSFGPFDVLHEEGKLSCI
jgi:hypothetical protein